MFPWGFRAKKGRRTGFSKFWPCQKWGASKKRKGEGEGERKQGNACRQTPGFWKPCLPGNGARDWLGSNHLLLTCRSPALHRRRSICCAPNRIWEKSNFSSVSTCKKRLCCHCYKMGWKAYATPSCLYQRGSIDHALWCETQDLATELYK